jgi:hypothetical protein
MLLFSIGTTGTILITGQRLKLQQLRTALVTGEQAVAWKDAERGRIDSVNGLVDSIGFEASLDEGPPSLQRDPEKSSSPLVPATFTNTTTTSAASSGTTSRRSASLCQAFRNLGALPANSPTFSFNLANCAEDNDRPAEASGLLTRYLQMSPKAADADRVRLRIADLNALAELPEQKGAQVRAIYASAVPLSRRTQARSRSDGVSEGGRNEPELRAYRVEIGTNE